MGHGLPTQTRFLGETWFASAHPLRHSRFVERRPLRVLGAWVRR